jgi:DNA-binding MarR family transcriptional regulator
MYIGPVMTEASDTPAASIAVTLAQDLRSFGGILKRRLREQADAGDLTPSQTAVLLRLEKDGPATTSALARIEGMRPQSMGSVIAALEEAGLVVGAPDPADGRQTILSVTDTFRTWLAHARAARQDWLSRTIDARLSPQEQEQLAAAMPLLHRLTGE